MANSSFFKRILALAHDIHWKIAFYNKWRLHYWLMARGRRSNCERCMNNISFYEYGWLLFDCEAEHKYVDLVEFMQEAGEGHCPYFDEVPEGVY